MILWAIILNVEEGRGRYVQGSLCICVCRRMCVGDVCVYVGEVYVYLCRVGMFMCICAGWACLCVCIWKEVYVYMRERCMCGFQIQTCTGTAAQFFLCKQDIQVDSSIYIYFFFFLTRYRQLDIEGGERGGRKRERFS